MSTRSFTARQALAGLLIAVSLPFLAVAKPPGRVLVECQTPAVQDQRVTAFEDVIGTFCPGVSDTFESCWRTLTKWVPVTCAPGCCAEKSTRLAVIEILPVAPRLEKESGALDLNWIECGYQCVRALGGSVIGEGYPASARLGSMVGEGTHAEFLTVMPTPVPEKRSLWPRVEIKLTIEVK